MYPRLQVARTLLRDDGAIFVSIDDNEVHHLHMIMNEVFGEENFVTSIVWQSRQSIQNDTDISVNHEYILVFARSRRNRHRRLKESNAHLWYNDPTFAAYPLPLDSSRFSNPDNDPRGPWKLDPFDAPNIRPNLTYEITNPKTNVAYWPPQGRCWRTGEDGFIGLFTDGRIKFGRNDEAGPMLKVYFLEKKEFGEVTNTWFTGQDHGTATHGTREIDAIMGAKGLFPSPKPTGLLQSLLRMSTRTGDLVLDFFAGSATMAHASLELDLEDGATRRFILVQLPEEIPPKSVAGNSGFSNIAEIGRERIRRVISQMQEGQLNLNADEERGFRCYELGRSHFQVWQDYSGDDPSQLQLHFDRFETPLGPGWDPAALLTEIILIEGFPLDSTTAHQSQITSNYVERITSDFHQHRLFICLDPTISKETITQLPLDPDDIFVCLDTALTDQAKLRLSDAGNLHVI